MATVTLQDVAPLHKHLNVQIGKADYLPTFEKALKEYSKKANIPGFRKGMVPAGLIRKMYGSSLFVDEVLKTVDREVNNYLQTEKLDIFAQPLPVDMNLAQLDVAKPEDYNFTFEVGMKPDFQIANLASAAVKRYKIDVTDAMVDEEMESLLNRYGNVTEPEEVASDENVLNVTFVETDAAGAEVEGGLQKDNSLLVKYFIEPKRSELFGKKKDDEVTLELSDIEERERAAVLSDLGLTEAEAQDKHFKIRITKIGQVEKRELNEEFFTQLFPAGDVKTSDDFRTRIRTELENQWSTETRNQLQHQLYHILLEGTQADFPGDFLKRWMKTNTPEGQPEKSDEQIEEEFPSFLNQLKWSLITEKLAQDANLEVAQDEVRQFAKEQLLSYMGGMAQMDEEQSWVRDYIDRMMKDRKYVEDAFHRLQTQKIFDWAETQVTPEEVPVSKEEFLKMNETHQHEHHEH
ncbi:MAG TPA: trigger factor [Chitinophagaceae bacterium]|nr:trigger factor [Chitinophagaceae bacterium]